MDYMKQDRATENKAQTPSPDMTPDVLPEKKNRLRPLCLLLLAAALVMVIYRLVPYAPNIVESWKNSIRGVRFQFSNFIIHHRLNLRYLLMLVSILVATFGVFKPTRSKEVLIISCVGSTLAIILDASINYYYYARVLFPKIFTLDYFVWLIVPAVLVIISSVIHYKLSPKKEITTVYASSAARYTYSPEKYDTASSAAQSTYYEIKEEQDGMKEYKVITLKDKFWSFKFRFEDIEYMLNDYARQGWKISSALTGRQQRWLGFFVGARNQLMIIMEREKAK